jgi:hypothetical protein
VRVVLIIVGVVLIVFGALDALWTTLWVDGNAGPFTRRHNSWSRRLVLRLAGRRHRVLSLTGPVVLVTSVLVWAIIPWAGWVLLFSGEPRSLIDVHRGTPAGVADRIYLTGSMMFTLGTGNFTPNGGFWEIAASLAGLSGLFMLTLAVTYLLAIIQAVVAKRSFASQVWSLGHNAEEFVINSWDGERFSDIETQIVSLTQQLQEVTEQHHAYPMLHFYHEARKKQSVAHSLAVFSEVLLIFAHGVQRSVRPAPSALFSAQRTVEEFLETLRSAFVEPSKKSTPAPTLANLASAGIPVVSANEFAEAIHRRAKRRDLLRGFLDSERRDWP